MRSTGISRYEGEEAGWIDDIIVFIIIICFFVIIIILDYQRAAHVSLEICCKDQLPSMPLALSFSFATYLSLYLSHTAPSLHNQIVQINGQDVRGLEMNQVLGLIQGAPGTMVSAREKASERASEKERERERLAHWFSIQ